MKWSVKRKIIVPFIVVGVCVLLMFYVFVGQEYVYAKKYAKRLLEFEIPEKTEVIEQDFDYGIFYGGGPWGSGGYPTFVAYQRVSTELSEKEIFEHYNTKNFEIYFEGTEELKKNDENQNWFEGTIKDENILNNEENTEKPIEVSYCRNEAG